MVSVEREKAIVMRESKKLTKAALREEAGRPTQCTDKVNAWWSVATRKLPLVSDELPAVRPLGRNVDIRETERRRGRLTAVWSQGIPYTTERQVAEQTDDKNPSDPHRWSPRSAHINTRTSSWADSRGLVGSGSPTKTHLANELAS